MSYEIRPYQEEAVSSIAPWWTNNDGNCLIEIPTGCGKSYILAESCKRFLRDYPHLRIIIATHSADLIKQDYLELIKLWPDVPAGIYSAGLKKRDIHHKILFVGIQSIYKKGLNLGPCDILFIDEVHTVSRKTESTWGKFISDLKIVNPEMRICGLSATIFRMDSGRLIGGENALFHGVAYSYGLLRAIQEGYLSNIISKGMETDIDLSKVKKRGGEFVAGELEKAVDIEAITKSAVKELIAYGENRKTWLIFCSGVDHCHHVAEEIRKYGIDCAVVTGDTSIEERTKIYDDLKNFRLRAVCSMGVMTTGVNIPNIDLIGGLRPTGSAGLLLQMVGRGTRVFPGKENCLYLDWGKNLARHGCIDKIVGRDKQESSGEGDAPIKNCPQCHSVLFAGLRICPDCGFEFPPPAAKIETRASTAPILSTQNKKEPPIWQKVITTQYSRHKGKNGKKDTMRVKYVTYTGDYSQYCCVEHIGFAREKFCSWFKMRKGSEKVPVTIDEAVGISYLPVDEILVQKNGKYFEIAAVRFLEQKEEPVVMSPQMEEEFEIPVF